VTYPSAWRISQSLPRGEITRRFCYRPLTLDREACRRSTVRQQCDRRIEAVEKPRSNEPARRLGSARQARRDVGTPRRRAEFGDGARHAAGGERLLARGVALQGALEYALRDCGEAEERECEQKVPVRARIESARRREVVDQRAFVRDAERGTVDTGE